MQSTQPEDKTTNQPTPMETDAAMVSRDLYSLIGGAPPIAFVKPTFKAKYNDKKKAASWVQQSFTNPARTDDLTLHHWIQESKINQEYPFSKFNRVIDVPDYSDEEYERHLIDSEWTKDETDYLFNLCRRYDLRFPVIQDRYDFPEKTRSIEDLKDRYYTVQRKLIKARPHLPGEYHQDRQTLMQQYTFDKAKETERKEALIALFNRTKEEIEQEQALFVEARRIEMNEPKLAREREALLNALQLEQAQQMPTTPLTPTGSGVGASAAASTSGGTSLSTPGGIGITGGTAGMDSKKKKKATTQDDGGVKKNRRISNASSGVLDDVIPERKEKMVQGVYVRSQKLPVVTKQALQQKLLKTMADMDIPVRPQMPTAQVVQKYDQLHHSLVHMLELKKTVDKLEVEQRARIQRGHGAGAGSRPSGSRDKKRR
ncbi:hypothetical protein K492DRAFT_240809 [Lichtheimia hyalospora FSU 10163]|nr:hypothetical protein K492DRAFT_240809 [Lichtheimia hyalospora FSU 10163]